jgi:hypothetical protein
MLCNPVGNSVEPENMMDNKYVTIISKPQRTSGGLEDNENATTRRKETEVYSNYQISITTKILQNTFDELLRSINLGQLQYQR